MSLVPVAATELSSSSLISQIAQQQTNETVNNNQRRGKLQNKGLNSDSQSSPAESKEQSSALCPTNFGPISLVDRSTNEQPTDISLSADSAKSPNENAIELSGNVQLSNVDLHLQSELITLDQEKGEFAAKQSVTIQNNSGQFSAQQATGNINSGEAELTDAQFSLLGNGGNGNADSITLKKNNQLDLSELNFSTCPQGDNSWRLYADNLTVDRDSGWGEADNVVLRIADVPVFYIPWLKFPIDDQRHTGILPPSIRSSDRNGFDYVQPIYWNIAPNYDATITPRYLENRGTQLGLEFRYLFGQHSGTQQIEFLQDRGQEDATISDNRWSYRLQHTGQWLNNWQASIDATGVSDRNYFFDLGTNLSVSNRDHLTRYGEVGYYTSHFESTISWIQFQPLSLTQTPYRQLPQARLWWQPTSSIEGVNFQIWGNYSQFRNDDITLPEADRALAAARISYPLEKSWGYIRPSVSIYHRQYDQSTIIEPSESLSVDVPIVSIDSQIIFERATDSGRQTLEPRLFLLYVPHEEQSEFGLYDTQLPEIRFERLFAENRFTGYDRIGDTQQASVALTSRYFTDDIEKFSWSVGQAFYFEDRQIALDSATDLTRKQSDIVSEITWHPSNAWQISAAIGYDASTKETEQGNTSIHFEPDDNLMVNLTHRYKSSNQEQGELSFFVPLGDRWKAVGRWNYDLINQQSLETMAGLEYESCCWAIRLVSRRYLNARLDANGAIIADQDGRFNQDLLFEFVFKGLSGTGRRGLRSQLDSRLTQ